MTVEQVESVGFYDGPLCGYVWIDGERHWFDIVEGWEELNGTEVPREYRLFKLVDAGTISEQAIVDGGGWKL